MPKAAKHTTAHNHRAAPYPISSTSLAPPIMATQGTPPPALGNDRHASPSWPPQNDERLMRARQQGMNWQLIASTYFPDKTANACRKRHERLMEKRNQADDWEGVKTETLAKAYIDVREQMWKILADRVGEKWQIVEAKCMEKGLKTLKVAGRTASRRERAGVNIGGSDLDDDIINDSRYSSRRSKSHEDDNSLSDSAIGPDPEHSLGRDDSNQIPYSAGGLSSSTNSYSPGRSYSTVSSTSYTPTIPAATHFGSSAQAQTLPPFQTQQQTLPSFSSAFGMPSISSVIRSHSPQRSHAVTTHC